MASLKDLIVRGVSRFIGDVNAADIYAEKHITIGGASTQFLKGDGTLDSSAYITSAALGSYLPLAGGTMTGAITRIYTAANDTPFMSISSDNKDVWLWRVRDNSYSGVSAAYGFGAKYIGTGTGDNNAYAFYADNQNGTQVEAIKMLQSGNMTIAKNVTVNGVINTSSGTGAHLINAGINFGSTGHIGSTTTGIGMYSTGSIWLRTFQTLGTLDNSKGLVLDSASITFNTKKVWWEGNDGANSGLDADLLDGHHGSYYAASSDIPTLVSSLENDANYIVGPSTSSIENIAIFNNETGNLAADSEISIRRLWDERDITDRIAYQNEYYPFYTGYISSSNEWTSTSSTQYTHYIIPLDDIRKIRVKSRSTNSTIIAFLKSYNTPVDGDTPDFATGYNSRIYISDTDTSIHEYDVPIDAKYLYVYRRNTSVGNYYPSYLAFTGIGITEYKGDGTGFIKDDGTVDTNTYAASSSLGNYLPLAGGSMSGAIDFGSTSSVTDITKGINFNTLAHIGCGATAGNLGVYNKGSIFIRHNQTNMPTSYDTNYGLILNGASITFNNKKVWWENNDGSESGLDADLLDGKHGSEYASASHVHGNIQNNGALQTTDITIASGDKLVVTDKSDSDKIARSSIVFDNSTMSQFLSKKGTWSTFANAGWGYANCTTAANILEKTATCTGYQYIDGGHIIVHFNYAVRAGSTLNINSTGAKAIKKSGVDIKDNEINGGTFALFTTVNNYYNLVAVSNWNEPYEANLKWGGRNIADGYSPTDAAMVGRLGANRSAYINPNAVTVEYSRDNGTTWLDYGATDWNKTGFFTDFNSSFTIGKSSTTNPSDANCLLRVTLRTGGYNMYTLLNKFIVYISGGGSRGCYCTITARTQANFINNVDTWVTIADKVSISGWSGYNVINTTNFSTYGNTQNSQYGEIRFLFGTSGKLSGYESYAGLTVYGVNCYGGVGWGTPSNLAKDGHIYSYSSGQNVTFPSNVTAASFIKAGGTSSQFLKADGSVDSNAYITSTALTDYVNLTGDQTITGKKTFTKGIVLNTDTSWNSTDRGIPFSTYSDDKNIMYVNTNANKGFTYNPNTGMLKAGSFMMRGKTNDEILLACGSTMNISAFAAASNVVTSITTATGSYTGVSNASGAVSFNIPSDTNHLTNGAGFITASDDKNTIFSGIGYCDTADSVSVKNVILPGFELASTDQRVLVYMASDNTKINAVLSVNGTTSTRKPIKIDGNGTTESNFPSGWWICQYDGTNWNLSKFQLSYSNITNTPTLATVATTGNYNDLSNKPNITDEKVKRTLTTGSDEYPVIFSSTTDTSTSPTETVRYSASLKANGNGDVVFTKSSTKCKLQYDSTNLCLNFMFE